jgi:hypothetical protein
MGFHRKEKPDEPADRSRRRGRGVLGKVSRFETGQA